jgi:hypothetical protein
MDFAAHERRSCDLAAHFDLKDVQFVPAQLLVLQRRSQICAGPRRLAAPFLKGNPTL